MTRLEGARSEQVATVTPSPPAVVSGSNAGTSASAQIPPPAASPSHSTDDEKTSAASPEQVQAAAKQIETYLKSVGRQLEFRVDDSTGRTVITVKDSATGEVIRQIPGEESLRLARKLGENAPVLVDLAV